jgi:hypothetical protein
MWESLTLWANDAYSMLRDGAPYLAVPFGMLGRALRSLGHAKQAE